jgi:hypothetical protein
MNALRWNLRSNGPDIAWVEAETLKWRYAVMPDLSFDDQWAAHRHFIDLRLHGEYIGEMFEDTFLSFEDALEACERWHMERDSDNDLDWVDRSSIRPDE